MSSKAAQDIQKKYDEFYEAGIKFCEEKFSRMKGAPNDNGISPVHVNLVKHRRIEPKALIELCRRLDPKFK